MHPCTALVHRSCSNPGGQGTSNFFACFAMDEWTIAPTPTWRPGGGPMPVRRNHSSPNLLSTSICCLPTLFRGVRRSPINKTSGLCCLTKPTSSHIEQFNPLNPTLRNLTVKGQSHRSDHVAGGMVHGSPATKLPSFNCARAVATNLRPTCSLRPRSDSNHSLGGRTSHCCCPATPGGSRMSTVQNVNISTSPLFLSHSCPTW